MTDLATALRHELDRLTKFEPKRFVHAKRLEPLLDQHDDVVDRLVLALARATGQPGTAVRLAFGLDPCAGASEGRKAGSVAGNGRERGLRA